MSDDQGKIRISWDDVNKADSCVPPATSPAPQASAASVVNGWQGLTALRIVVASVVAVVVLGAMPIRYLGCVCK